jgi:hypothetical protein
MVLLTPAHWNFGRFEIAAGAIARESPILGMNLAESKSPRGFTSYRVDSIFPRGGVGRESVLCSTTAR